MARDTRTDAPTLVETDREEINRFDLDWIEYDEKLWSVESGIEINREKIESEKSDVQPKVEHDWSNFVTESVNGIIQDPEGNDSLNEFDEGIKGLTTRRGDIYGHPADDFNRIIQMQKALDDCDDEFARHIMNMICVKMSRLVKTPDHSDSWLDIVGYVRTWFMIKEKNKDA